MLWQYVLQKVEKSLIARIFAKFTCIFKGDAEESSDTEHFIGTWSVWDQSLAVNYWVFVCCQMLQLTDFN